MGVGFPPASPSTTLSFPPKEDLNHKFICGNYDNYRYASKSPNCLNRFGYIVDKGIFYISGGYSMDVLYRIPNSTWWEWEQLSLIEMEKCMCLYKKVKPAIVCSHEAPGIGKYWSLYYSKMKNMSVISSTEQFLTELWEEYEPQYWIHGHFHQFYTHQEGRTMFIGLDELLDGKKENCIYEIST